MRVTRVRRNKVHIPRIICCEDWLRNYQELWSWSLGSAHINCSVVFYCHEFKNLILSRITGMLTFSEIFRQLLESPEFTSNVELTSQVGLSLFLCWFVDFL
jgi:hypothetical protein